MLERSELEFLSIYYYLKEGVLAHDFSIEVQNDALVQDLRPGIDGTVRNDVFIVDSSSSAYGGIHSTKGRGWLSFELNKPEPCKIYDPSTSGYVNTFQTPFHNTPLTIPTEREESLIIVRDQNGDPLPRDYYRIDYRDCRVRWPSNTTPSGALGLVPTSIDHRFHMVSLLDGYPTDEAPPELPIVAIYTQTENKQGYQIGPGVLSESRYTIDVFANSETEKKSILNKLHTALYNKHVPVIDFNRSGEPLRQWGVINEDFVQDITHGTATYRSYLTLNPSNGQSLYFVNLEVQHNASPRESRSKIMRHMGKLMFTTRTYSDRDPELVGKFSGMGPPPGGFDSLILRSYSS
jgi:hypothetical protein